MNSLRRLLAAALLALAVPAAAAPIFTPSTTTVGGIVNATHFVVGVDGGSPNANQWPAAEDPSKVVDGVIGGGSKYLNFAVTNTAVIFRGTQQRVADRLQLWVANDAPERDPASYTLYGTNTTIPALTVGQTFALSNFAVISTGALDLPADRDTTADAAGFSQSIPIPNTATYASYLLVFPAVKGPAANAMQISEVQLYDSGIIGVEQFDYPDGSIATKNGGTFWNYKNIAPIGQSGAASDWDNVTAAPTVSSGRLVTQNSSARREYNGPGEGAPPSDEGNGAVNDVTVAKSVYYRVTVTTGATVPTELGLSSYDFGTERIFFGKRDSGNNFVVAETGVASTGTFTTVLPNTTYTLVGRLDYAANTIRLFINPILNAAEPAVPAASATAVAQPYTGTNWSTAFRLFSSGGSPVIWDDLVVATSWDDLGTVVDTVTDEDDGHLLGSVSLREAVKYSPTGSLITFLPGLSGGTITLTHADGDMVIDRALTIDASALPGGITVSGNNTSRHFFVDSGKSLTLRGLTLTGGNSGNNDGGSINNGGTLTLTQCTLSGNVSQRGGAIYNDGTAALTHCTLTGNHGDISGGAIRSAGALTLTRCTLSGNRAAANGGGAIYQADSSLILADSIIAGNVATLGPDIRRDPFGSIPPPTGVNLIGNLTGSDLTASATVLTGDPKLSPLGYFGGPVQTMHPLIGSPAIDAAGSTNPGGTDARGFPRFEDGDTASSGKQLDIGAVEAGIVLLVNQATDSGGSGTLRTRLANAAILGEPSFRIVFDPAVFPASTITLNGNQLTPPAGISIFIDASNLTAPVTLSAGGNSRVFNIPATATVAMHSVKIVNGKAPDGSPSASKGGGVLNDGTASLFACTISDNRAGFDDASFGADGGSGGGIFSSGPLSLTACTLFGNQTGRGDDNTDGDIVTRAGHGGSGGAIYSTGPMSLTSCTLFGNSTASGGNRIIGDGGSGNGGSGGFGAGIFKGDQTPYRVTACTFAGNRTGAGGTGSAAGEIGRGAGLFGGRPTLQHCLLTDHLEPDGSIIDLRASFITLEGTNLLSVMHTSSGTGPGPIINPNALLAPLGDYGGPTQTMPPLPGSPARDAATASARRTDQRGFPLFGVADLGAFEAQQLGPIPNLTTNEDTPVTSAAFPVGQIGTLSGTSSNTVLVPHANITFAGSGATRTVTVTPALNASGTATITVADSFGAAEQTFTVTVTAVNDPPIISNITGRFILEDGTTGALPFTVSDVETAAAALTVSVHSSDLSLVPNANITFTGTGTNRTVTATPAANQGGTAFITVTVSDGTGGTASDTFTVDVTEVNDAPTITNIADRTLLEDANTGAVAFTIGDVETAAASLTVAGVSNNLTLVPNANITFGGSGASRTVTVTPAANQSGTAVIAVGVNDGTEVILDVFTLTVTAVNDAPSFLKGADVSVVNTAGAQTLTAWATSLSAGPNESGQTLSFTVTNTNNALFTAQPAIAANGTLTFTPAAAANGSAVVSVRINDTGGTANGGVAQSAVQTFTITTTSVLSLVVTTTADNVAGSLRQALANAATIAGASTVTFAPGLTGNIVLSTEIVITDPAGITVDASSRPNGVTIDGGPGTNRHFRIASGTTATFLRLKLTGGDGGGAETTDIGHGGALRNQGNLTLRECTISGCTSPSFGGALYNENPGVITIERSTLSGNTATAGGGAIQQVSPQLITMTACTIANNSGGFEAGGINAPFGPLFLIHCTVSGNAVTNPGSNGVGGVRGGDLTVQDSLISGNTDANTPGTPDISPGFTAGGQNLIGGDAKLAPLADYGGPTQTMALRPGSPARDVPDGGINNDQRGFPQVGAFSDLGAYEAGNLTGANIATILAETLPNTGPASSVTPEADFDGDGMSNQGEIIAGTLPANPTSVFRPVATLDEGDLLITFPTLTGRTYTLQTSDTLAAGSWLPTGLTFNGDNTTTAFRLPFTPGVNRRFYRVVVSQP